MNNYEKFVEVFGFKPDKDACIPKCPENIRETGCKYYKWSDDPSVDCGCKCEDWWDEEYSYEK